MYILQEIPSPQSRTAAPAVRNNLSISWTIDRKYPYPNPGTHPHVGPTSGDHLQAPAPAHAEQSSRADRPLAVVDPRALAGGGGYPTRPRTHSSPKFPRQTPTLASWRLGGDARRDTLPRATLHALAYHTGHGGSARGARGGERLATRPRRDDEQRLSPRTPTRPEKARARLLTTVATNGVPGRGNQFLPQRDVDGELQERVAPGYGVMEEEQERVESNKETTAKLLVEGKGAEKRLAGDHGENRGRRCGERGEDEPVDDALTTDEAAVACHLQLRHRSSWPLTDSTRGRRNGPDAAGDELLLHIYLFSSISLPDRTPPTPTRGGRNPSPAAGRLLRHPTPPPSPRRAPLLLLASHHPAPGGPASTPTRQAAAWAWSKAKKFLKRTLSFSDSTPLGSPPPPPKGLLAVCVGPAMQRFVIPMDYLKHRAFAALLREAEQEFRFHQERVLRIPCEVLVFETILKAVKKNKMLTQKSGKTFTPTPSSSSFIFFIQPPPLRLLPLPDLGPSSANILQQGSTPEDFGTIQDFLGSL
ncbi:hypothetical protein HU200_057330 [Digitaria exilis]|uniref:Small auxin up regulated protein n=1 Tax=Digitaria exilis TaxID=1010633 RepID=A0A835AL23_9POAL|nr:hypothetical protein HU200_057330 [Digitaria exilis]